MNLATLKSFVVLAEHLNFTNAAKHLYISQPRLSGQILAIEKELGVALFARDSGSVSLTPAGRVLYGEVKPLLSKFDLAIERALMADKGIAGSLLVLFSDYYCGHIASDAVRAFRKAHPDVEVGLFDADTDSFVKRLVEVEADVGVCPRIAVSNEPRLEVKTLVSGCPCLAVSSEHPLAGRESVALSELEGEAFVISKSSSISFSAEVMRAQFEKHSVMPRVSREASDAGSLLVLVEAGEGITLLTREFAERCPNPNLRFLDIEGFGANWRSDIVLAWRKGSKGALLDCFLSDASAMYDRRHRPC